MIEKEDIISKDEVNEIILSAVKDKLKPFEYQQLSRLFNLFDSQAESSSLKKYFLKKQHEKGCCTPRIDPSSEYIDTYSGSAMSLFSRVATCIDFYFENHPDHKSSK